MNAATATRGLVCIAVAHAAEAQPIVGHLGLTRVHEDGGVLRFCRDDTWLVITGQGRVATAASMGYLHGRLQAPRGAAWINIGVAGHADLDVGSVLVANRIDGPGSSTEYPAFVYRRPCPASPLRTVDAPTVDYPSNSAVDMEASAFFDVATKFTKRELVTVLKIVSDNPTTAFARSRVPDLMRASLPALDEILAALRGASAQWRGSIADPPALQHLTRCWRVSVSHRNLLRRHLWRLTTLAPEFDVLAAVSSARDVREMVARVEALADRFALERGMASS